MAGRGFGWTWGALRASVPRACSGSPAALPRCGARQDKVKNVALMRRKVREDPAQAAAAGMREDVMAQLAEWVPSYCAESPLDSVPTGKVLRPAGY